MTHTSQPRTGDGSGTWQNLNASLWSNMTGVLIAPTKSLGDGLMMGLSGLAALTCVLLAVAGGRDAKCPLTICVCLDSTARKGKRWRQSTRVAVSVQSQQHADGDCDRQDKKPQADKGSDTHDSVRMTKSVICDGRAGEGRAREDHSRLLATKNGRRGRRWCRV